MKLFRIRGEFSLLLFYFIVGCLPLKGQSDYAVSNISKDLIENASAVIRNLDMTLELEDYDELSVTRHEVITVLNRRGLNSLNPIAPYDDFTKIQKIEATLYNKKGEVLKRFKKKDFEDVSASGSNLYSDNRLLILDLVPPTIPFTFEMKVSYETSTTAYLPSFNPSPNYYVSTESANYTLKNPRRIPIRPQEFKLKEFNIQKEVESNRITYRVSNILSMEPEPYSPFFTEFSPYVRMVPVKFNLGGKTSEVRTWDEFANWQRTSLLSGRSDLSKSTLKEIDELVEGVLDPQEKTRLIYEYMQNKTRYISVQVGLGGWRPAPAMEVDQLGYGDCKGLTNYTQALLKSQGITSYYTIVDAGSDGNDIDEDFVALQGNHVILTVPFDDQNVFLECTSQKVPYNFIGRHTDNRKVLAITPEGASIIKTHPYPAEENLTKLTASITFDESLKALGEVHLVSEGLAYDFKYNLSEYSQNDLEQSYRDEWGYLNRIEFTSIELLDNRRDIRFEEKLNLSFASYASNAGDVVLLNPNIFTRRRFVPEYNPNRELPVEIRRGYSYDDTIEIQLPKGYEVTSEFNGSSFEGTFGTYKSELEITQDGRLIYHRLLLLKSGRFENDKYEDYLEFIKRIITADNQKLAIQQK